MQKIHSGRCSVRCERRAAAAAAVVQVQKILSERFAHVAHFGCTRYTLNVAFRLHMRTGSPQSRPRCMVNQPTCETVVVPISIIHLAFTNRPTPKTLGCNVSRHAHLHSASIPPPTRPVDASPSARPACPHQRALNASTPVHPSAPVRSRRLHPRTLLPRAWTKSLGNPDRGTSVPAVRSTQPALCAFHTVRRRHGAVGESVVYWYSMQ